MPLRGETELIVVRARRYVCCRTSVGALGQAPVRPGQGLFAAWLLGAAVGTATGSSQSAVALYHPCRKGPDRQFGWFSCKGAMCCAPAVHPTVAAPCLMLHAHGSAASPLVKALLKEA